MILYDGLLLIVFVPRLARRVIALRNSWVDGVEEEESSIASLWEEGYVVLFWPSLRITRAKLPTFPGIGFLFIF